MYNDSFLEKKLNERRAADAFRSLRLPYGKIDFCSNDYLGIVKNNLLQPLLYNSMRIAETQPGLLTSATGSRLLAGNSSFTEETETLIAGFHDSDTALIFNSGYDANTGILSCVPQKGDTILYDALSHASIRDGVRLSFAGSFSFAHNDVKDLAKKLQQATGNIFVVTESVFSMDGDQCPLADIIDVCKKYNAHLILDEAHATGVVGEKGEGLAQHLGVHKDVFCRMHTFGKACGCHGAVALGSQKLKDYLVNFSRSFIYTTALPEHAIACINASYRTFPAMVKERLHLQNIINLFQSASMPYQKLESHTPIQVVIIPGNSAAKKVAENLQQTGFDVRAILYPTVPKQKERLRIVLHSFNTVEEVESLVKILSGGE
ncbi:MAG TPA: 8-amino-7-oxononanoate synthase [Chitinophagaceae bacterium]|nr:8-amino-7-oxononanoate synthase [Chitinophagaceae bacterium]